MENILFLFKARDDLEIVQNIRLCTSAMYRVCEHFNKIGFQQIFYQPRVHLNDNAKDNIHTASLF